MCGKCVHVYEVYVCVVVCVCVCVCVCARMYARVMGVCGEGGDKEEGVERVEEEGGFTCTYRRLSWIGSFLSTFWSEKKNFFLKVRITVSSIPCSRRDLSGFSQFTGERSEGGRE